jgi:hypothetical protein
VKSAATLPEAAREEVRRVVVISRLAGVSVAVALVLGAAYINRDDPTSSMAVAHYFTVAVGLAAFLALSTLARIGHARVGAGAVRGPQLDRSAPAHGGA